MFDRDEVQARLLLLNAHLADACVLGDVGVLKGDGRHSDLIFFSAVAFIYNAHGIRADDLPVFVSGAPRQNMDFIARFIDLDRNTKRDELKVSGFHIDVLGAAQVDPVASFNLPNRVNVGKIFDRQGNTLLNQSRCFSFAFFILAMCAVMASCASGGTV